MFFPETGNGKGLLKTFIGAAIWDTRISSRNFGKKINKMLSNSSNKQFNPLTPRRTRVSLLFEISILLQLDNQENFLLASRLWVGRRKEPILGYVPKKRQKIINLVHKGLTQVIKLVTHFLYC